MDATARYNLNNLATGPVIDPLQVALYKRLLENVQINPALAQKTAQAVAEAAPAAPVAAGSPPPAARTSVPLGLNRIEDLLAVSGYTIADITKLREVAVVLPVGQTTINVNTAPAEVISALVSGFSVAQANALVARRKQADYRTTAEFTAQLFGVPQSNYPAQSMYDVKSEWFLVRSRVRLDRAALDAESLVNRQLTAPNATTIQWVRQN